MEKQKLTIFLSHSHKDKEQVMKIRNVLEAVGCEPLIFFLKCLEDKHAVLDQFIKEEIEARNVFVYCRSKNSKKSVWVQKELEYIRSFDENRLYIVDVDKDFNLSLIAFLQAIADILRHNRIFFSYSMHDKGIAEKLIGYMKGNGYQVNEFKSGGRESYSEQMERMIKEGLFLYLATPYSTRSPSCRMELEYALSHHSESRRDLLVVTMGDCEVPTVALRKYQCLRLSPELSEADFKRLGSVLRAWSMQEDKDMNG